MSSEIGTCNMALGHLAQMPVTSLSLDVSKPALLKLLVFKDTALDVVLKAHDWNEAAQEVTLNALSLTGQAGSYPYIYALPTDALRVSRIGPPGYTTRTEWRLGTHLDATNNRHKVLYAMGPLDAARVIVRLPWDQMSVHLAVAVSLKMAELACFSITSDRRRESDIRDKYLMAMAEAGVVEAFESEDNDDMNPLMHPFGQMRGSAL